MSRVASAIATDRLAVAAADPNLYLDAMQIEYFIVVGLGALAGGFVAGLAGFGTGITAMGIWLYVLPPHSWLCARLHHKSRRYQKSGTLLIANACCLSSFRA
ncbi:MAG: putative membrane protein YfcA [Hyphomicrobiaceae bacterium]|jgi:uncharacterized membrane protein YfcA